jgi:UDP-N-acetylglucosamine 3-dehydrogenase
MKRWRIGIIGCGWAGSKHAQVIQRLSERVELCALADINMDVIAARAREWNVSSYTTNYRDILNSEDLDAVSVCLPHQLHAPATIQAAEAGLHVLVEKPLATNLAEADAMIAATEAAGVNLMVAEVVRFSSIYKRASKIIRSGALGNIFLLRISREHQMHDYLRQRPWFLEEKSAGIMYSGGIHDFELLRMLAGEIEHVYGLAGRKALCEMVADDTSIALVGMQDGSSAVIVESFSLRTPRPGVHLTVHGSLGSMWVCGNHIQIYSSSRDGQQDLVEEITVPSRDGFLAEIEHFLDCLDSNKEPITSGREERKPLAAVLAVYESIDRGKRVYLKGGPVSGNCR